MEGEEWEEGERGGEWNVLLSAMALCEIVSRWKLKHGNT